MEQKTESRQNENGSYTQVTTTKTTPDDGFVRQKDIVTSDFTNYGEYHKGYQINKHYETDNPKVVIPVLIFFMVLVALFPVGYYFMIGSINSTSSDVGMIIFISFAVFFEIMIVKEIIKVKKKFKNKNSEHDSN